MKISTLIASALLVSGIATSTLVAKSEAVSVLGNDPAFQDFQKLQENMNQIFERFNSKFFEDSIVPSPKTDLKDAKDHYEVKVDLPGGSNADIKVKANGNVLNIDATTKKVEEEKGDKYIKHERFVGALHKSLTLPKDADTDKLKTDYKDGILTVTIPKKK